MVDRKINMLRITGQERKVGVFRFLMCCRRSLLSFEGLLAVHFKRKITNIKLSGWSRKEREQDFALEYFDNKYVLPVYSVTED
jgi:hypothetical protein